MSNNTVNTQALHDVVVATAAIRLWSGQVTLKRDELSSVKGLPPSRLVSDGSKRIIDPKALSKLESQRRAVNRELSRVGLVSPMGYLIAPRDESTVHEVMADTRKKFNEYRDSLLSSYTKLCLDWEKANPEHVDMLRHNRPDVAVVAAACSFNYCVYKMAPVGSEVGAGTFTAMASATAGILAEDIAASARGILKDSLSESRDTPVTQKAVNVVRELVRKLRGFEMFDSRITATADALDKALNVVRKTGPLDLSEVMVIRAMLRDMADPATLFDYGSGQAANIPADNAIHVMAPQLELPAVVQATVQQDSQVVQAQEEAITPVFF